MYNKSSKSKITTLADLQTHKHIPHTSHLLTVSLETDSNSIQESE